MWDLVAINHELTHDDHVIKYFKSIDNSNRNALNIIQ